MPSRPIHSICNGYPCHFRAAPGICWLDTVAAEAAGGSCFALSIHLQRGLGPEALGPSPRQPSEVRVERQTPEKETMEDTHC